MKKIHYCILLFVLTVFASCNKGEGLGGSSAIEGYVYEIVHTDDNFSFETDTIPAVGKKVYIVYGENEDGPVADKEVDTNKNGMYHFEYLREGKYNVYALSSYPDELAGRKEAVVKAVRVGSGTAHAEDIYIHTGKAYGLSMIKGSVFVQYYDKYVKIGEPVPAVETRVYIKKVGENAPFNDVRVGNEGDFIFQKIPPGKYEIYSVTEKINQKNQLFPTGLQTIDVKQAHVTYELSETFNIIINI